MTPNRIDMLRSLATDPAFLLLCDIAEQEVMREFHAKLKSKNITESDEDRWRIYTAIR